MRPASPPRRAAPLSRAWAPLVVSLALAAVPQALRAQGAPRNATNATADAPAAASARTVVEGRVLDAGTGEPLRARVTLVPLGAALGHDDAAGRATATDDEGRFRFAAVAPGAARLRVRALGFAPRDTTLAIGAAAEGAGGGAAAPVVAVELRLVEVPRLLSGVRVVAKSPERERFERTPDVSGVTLSGGALSRAPALGEADVLRAVALLPGVAARSDYTAGYNVRGGEADQNLVLLDGIPVYNPFHFGGMFGTFIDEAVQRVDLTAGGFGPSFGGRLSSVLDVESREESRPGVHGAAEVSLLSSTLTAGGAFGAARGSWNVAARRTYADRVVGALTAEEFPYHFTDAQIHAAALLPGGGTLSVTAYGGVDELLPGDDPRADDDLKFDWGNALAGVTWSQPLGERTSVAQRASLSTFRTHFDADAGRTSLFDAVSDLSLAGGVTHRRGAHTLGAGYELSRYLVRYRERVAAGYRWDTGAAGEDVVFDPDTTRPPLRQTQAAGALYAEDLWRVGPRLLVRVGVRAERVPEAGWWGVSPRVSAKYWLTKDLALTAAGGRYAQWMHAVRNEDLPLRVFDVWLTSDRTVPVSLATHAVGGVERWLGERHVVRVEGYWKGYRDLPEPRSVVDPRIRKEDIRLFEGTSYGADVFLRRLEIAGALSGWVAYGYGVSARTRDGVRYAPGQDRRHNANAVLSWAPGRGRYALGARYGVATGNPYTAAAGTASEYRYDPATGQWLPHAWTEVRGARNAERYPLYQRLDLSLERAFFPRWGAVRTTLSVVNVFNRRNVFLYEFDYERTPPTARALSQFPLLPTVGLKVEF